MPDNDADASANSSTNLTLIYEGGALKATWNAAAYPAGYSFIVQLLDNSGTPFSPQPIIIYSGSSATMTGAMIQPGALLSARLQALSPWDASNSLTLINLPPPQNVALSYHHGSLHISWASPDSSRSTISFIVELLNQNQAPIDPQPQVTYQADGSPTSATIEGTALQDKTTYYVHVREQESGSLSAWSAATSIFVDKTTPTSSLLLALRQRLLNAGTSFGLSPQIVQSPNVTDLFGSLLQASQNTIPVTQAVVTSDTESVTLNTTATLFTRQAGAKFVFTDVNNLIQLDLVVAHLGGYSLTQLYSDKLLPVSTVDSSGWATSLSFTDVELLLSSLNNLLTLDGPASPAWSIINLAEVGLGPVTPNIQITGPTSQANKQYVPRVRTSLNLSSISIPIYLQLPAGLAGWSIGLNAADGFNLGQLSKLYPLFGGANTGLPTDVAALNTFIITYFSLNFLPNPTYWNMTLGLSLGPVNGADPTWDAVPGVFTVRSMLTDLIVETYQTAPGTIMAASSGSLRGQIQIANSWVDVAVVVPGGPDGWLLRGTVTVPLNSLADLSTYMGGSQTALSDALAPLGNFQGYTVSEVEIWFMPSPGATITRLSFGLELNTWTISALSWFTVNSLTLGFDVESPLSNSLRVVSGEIDGLLTLVTVSIAFVTTFRQGEQWVFSLGNVPTMLPNIEELRSLVDTNAVKAFLPQQMPKNGAFDLAWLGFSYNLAQNYFGNLGFYLNSQQTWEIITGKFVLSDILVDIELAQSGPSASQVMTGEVGGTMSIGDFVVYLGAAKKSSTDEWVLQGILQDEYLIDFTAMIKTITGLQNIEFPTAYGFPAAMTIYSANFNLVPSTGAFDFDGGAYFDWSINFGNSTFSILQVNALIHLPGSDETGGSLVWVGGNFQFTAGFGSIGAYASAQFGTSGTQTILEVEISASDQVSAPDVVNALISSGGTNVWDDVPAPADYIKPSYVIQAGATINLNANTFLVHGQYTLPGGSAGDAMYASAALLVQKPPPPAGNANQTAQWGFVFAATLQNWSFARISAGLGVIENILSVNQTNASILLSQLENESAALLKPYVPALGTDMPVRRGLNFYAELKFTSGLLTKVAQLIGLTVQGPFTVSGYIPANSSQSEFQATLTSLTLLNVFAFNNIVLLYTVQQSSAFTLKGQIVVHIDQDYRFQGDVLVTDAAATASIATTQAIINPLGIPGITIISLRFDLNHSFGAANSDTQYKLGGSVTFVDTVTLNGFILFSGATAVVSLVQLSNLYIDALFRQCLGTSWPTSLLDIKLKNGSLYYAPQTVSVNDSGVTVNYPAGFHASTDVDIYFIHDFHLQMDLAAGQGVTATGGYEQPINWGFIKLYRAGDTTKGPQASINSQQNVFTLSGGFEIFSVPLLSLLIQVGSSTLTSTIKMDQEVEPFGKPQFNFVWDEQGFRVTNWSLPNLRLPDFDIEDLNIEGICPTTGILKIPIRTEFQFNTNFSITPDLRLQLTLNGTFNLVTESSGYTDDPLITAQVVNALWTIPFPGTGSFTWSDLASSFIDCIVSAASSIFENIVKDPENLAKLLAVAGVEWGIQQVTDFLVCEDASAAEAAAFVEAAQSALPVAVSIFGSVVTVGGMLGTTDEDGHRHNDDSSDSSDTQTARPAKPGAPTLSFSNGQVQVSWSSVANANSYSAVASENGRVFKSSNATGSTSTSLKLDAGHVYDIQVVASGPGGVSDAGDASRITLLTHPTITAFTFANNAATVKWNPVAFASGYSAQIVDANNNPLGTPITVAGADASSANLPVINLSAGTYKARVMATSNASNVVPSDWAVSSQTISKLGQTSISSVSYLNGQVKVIWSVAVPGATAYQAQLIDSQGNPVGSPVNASGGNVLEAVIPATGVAAGTYRARVSAISAAENVVNGDWAVSAETLTKLGTVGASTLSYESSSGKLTASWSPGVTGATNYQIQLVNADNAPAGDPLSVPASTLMVEIAYVNLPAGAYRVRVMASAPADAKLIPGEWVTSQWGVTRLGTVNITALAFNGQMIRVSWAAAVPQATGYTVQLLEDNNTPLADAVAVAGGGTLSVNLAYPNTPTGVYKARVMATSNAPQTIPGVWVISTQSLGQLYSPSVISLTYYQGQVRFELSRMAGNIASYEVQLVDSGGNPIASPYSMTAASTSGSFTPPALPAGVYKARSRSLSADPNIASSPWTTSPLTLTKLSMVSITGVSFANNQLTVRWSEVIPDAQGYQAQLVDPNDHPTGNLGASGPGSLAAAILVGTLQPGQYKATVLTMPLSTSYIPSDLACSAPIDLMMEVVYQSLKLIQVSSNNSQPVLSGMTITFIYSVTNISSKTLTIPPTINNGITFYFIGGFQFWVERLGPDSSIPSMPAGTTRNGNCYDAGHIVMSTNSTWAPSETYPFTRQLYTSGYPAGTYRFYVDYKKLSGEILQSAFMDIQIK
jgi:hypothetical protein